MRDYPYLSRVVAATNKATSEADIVRLRREGLLRGDIIGRFTRRYTLLPLPKRPQEIILILMAMIRWGKRWKKYPVIRISRIAFDVLHSYSFPFNIRDLATLTRTLPDRLIEEMAHPYRSSSNGTALPDCSIRLRDLDEMRGVNRAAMPRTPLRGEAEPEEEFYEFSVQETDVCDVSTQTQLLSRRATLPTEKTPTTPNVIAMHGDNAPDTAEKPSLNTVAFCEWFQACVAEHAEDLRRLRDNAESWHNKNPQQDKLPGFLKDEGAKQSLRTIVRALIDLLVDFRGKHGVAISRNFRNEIFLAPMLQEALKQMPYSSLCPTATLPASSFSQFQKVALQAARKPPSAYGTSKRLPRGVQVDVIVSLLFGKPMYRS
jgi:hypothetical protein